MTFSSHRRSMRGLSEPVAPAPARAADEPLLRDVTSCPPAPVFRTGKRRFHTTATVVSGDDNVSYAQHVDRVWITDRQLRSVCTRPGWRRCGERTVRPGPSRRFHSPGRDYLSKKPIHRRFWSLLSLQPGEIARVAVDHPRRPLGVVIWRRRSRTDMPRRLTRGGRLSQANAA